MPPKRDAPVVNVAVGLRDDLKSIQLERQQAALHQLQQEPLPAQEADLVTIGVVDLLVTLVGKPDASRQMVAAACRVLARFAALPGPLQAAVATPAAAAALWALLGPQQARPAALPEASPSPKAKPGAAKLGAELRDEEAWKAATEAVLRCLASASAADGAVLAALQARDPAPLVALLSHTSARLQMRATRLLCMLARSPAVRQQAVEAGAVAALTRIAFPAQPTLAQLPAFHALTGMANNGSPAALVALQEAGVLPSAMSSLMEAAATVGTAGSGSAGPPGAGQASAAAGPAGGPAGAPGAAAAAGAPPTPGAGKAAPAKPGEAGGGTRQVLKPEHQLAAAAGLLAACCRASGPLASYFVRAGGLASLAELLPEVPAAAPAAAPTLQQGPAAGILAGDALSRPSSGGQAPGGAGGSRPTSRGRPGSAAKEGAAASSGGAGGGGELASGQPQQQREQGQQQQQQQQQVPAFAVPLVKLQSRDLQGQVLGVVAAVATWADGAQALASQQNDQAVPWARVLVSPMMPAPVAAPAVVAVLPGLPKPGAPVAAGGPGGTPALAPGVKAAAEGGAAALQRAALACMATLLAAQPGFWAQQLELQLAAGVDGAGGEVPLHTGLAALTAALCALPAEELGAVAAEAAALAFGLVAALSTEQAREAGLVRLLQVLAQGPPLDEAAGALLARAVLALPQGLFVAPPRPPLPSPPPTPPPEPLPTSIFAWDALGRPAVEDGCTLAVVVP